MNYLRLLKSPRNIFSIVANRSLLIPLLAVVGATASTTQAKIIHASSPDLLVVVGAGGTDVFEEQFNAWISVINEATLASQSSVTFIGTEDPGIGTEDPREETDRERLEEILTSPKQNKQTARWIILVGHGTYANDNAKFNLRGPDVTAKQLGQWLDSSRRHTVVVNCASASGPFIDRLSGDKRVVITATKSGNEKDFALFGKYFMQALIDDASDLDHDESVSALEAFIRASKQVDQYYASADELATEHALIDDNGDKKGTPANFFRGARPVGQAKEGSPIDGYVSARSILWNWGEKLDLTSEQLTRRDELERMHESLRVRRESMSEEEYDQALLPIMSELARLYISDAEDAD